MYRLSAALLLVLLLLAGCAGQDAPPAPTSAAEPTAGQRPTQPAGSQSPANDGSSPTRDTSAAAAGQGALIYNVPEDGSIRALLLAQPNRELMLADPLTPGAELPWALSPDGRTLALVTGRDWLSKDPSRPWTATLWTVNVDETEPVRLLDLHPPAVASDALAQGDQNRAVTNWHFQQLQWTRDGSRIIVASAHEGQVDLYAVRVADGSVSRLTDTPDVEAQAQLSVDGATLGYLSVSTFGTGAGWGDVGVWGRSLSGGTPVSLLPPIEFPLGASLLGWTNDGRAVTQSVDQRTGGATLAVSGMDGTQQVIATGAEPQAAWNPASQQLAISTVQRDSPGKLLIWSAGDEAPIPVADLVVDTAFRWSPDGAALLVCSGFSGEAQAMAIWDGSALHPLAAGLSCDEVAWGTGGVFAVGGRFGGVIASTDGSVIDTLPPNVLPGAWDGDTLIAIAETATSWVFQQRVGDAWSEMPARATGRPTRLTHAR